MLEYSLVLELSNVKLKKVKCVYMIVLPLPKITYMYVVLF